MKKTLIAIIASVFSTLIMSMASSATGNGVVIGADDTARGIEENSEEIVNGAADTAEDIVGPGKNNSINGKDGIVEPETPKRVKGVSDPQNPSTGIAAIPFAMTLGSIGVAAIAAMSGKRR
ncbi:MAG: hypothetical protein LBR74_05190 [Eubacterium sp.]|nr:hypothetical protein [Eubacterium sp.]